MHVYAGIDNLFRIFCDIHLVSFPDSLHTINLGSIITDHSIQKLCILEAASFCMGDFIHGVKYQEVKNTVVKYKVSDSPGGTYCIQLVHKVNS